MVGVAAFVAALAEDAERRNVSHDFIGVAGDPGSVPPVTAFEPERVIHHHFATQNDQLEPSPELPDLHRIRVTIRQLAIAVEPGEQQGGGVPLIVQRGVLTRPQLLAGGWADGKVDDFEDGSQRSGQRLHLGVQHQIHGGGDGLAVHLWERLRIGEQRGIGALITRQRVGVGAASLHEKGDRAGMGALDFQLGVAGPIAADAVVVERGGVAGVADHDGAKLAGGAAHSEHRHVVIHRTRQRALAHAAAVHGDPGQALLEFQRGGREVGDGLSHQGDGLIGEILRVPAHGLNIRGLHGQVERRVAANDGPAVSMRNIQRQAVAAQAELLEAAPGNGLAEVALDALQIERHQHRRAAAGILERQRRGINILANAFRGPLAAPIPGHPHGLFRRDVDFGHAGFPGGGALGGEGAEQGRGNEQQRAPANPVIHE